MLHDATTDTSRSWITTNDAAANDDWHDVHRRLCSIATTRCELDADEAALLVRAQDERVWRAFGCGSMIAYMQRVLHYQAHSAAERLRVARALVDLPRMHDALAKADLCWSGARALSRVATTDTEAAWLERARGKVVHEIEAMVAGRKRGSGRTRTRC